MAYSTTLSIAASHGVDNDSSGFYRRKYMNWNLEYLFKTEEDFLKALGNLDSYIEKLASFQGKLKKEKNLVDLFLIQRDFEEALDRVYQYASLKSDLNKKDVKNATNLSKVYNVLFRVNEVTSYVDPEILELGKDKVMDIINKHPEIEEQRFLMQKLFDQNEHILSKREEQLLSLYGSLNESGSELYSALSTADGEGVEVTLKDGEKVIVTKGNWTALVDSAKCEEDRKTVFKAHFSTYEKNKNTYAEIYKNVLNADKAVAKARNYESSLVAHLDKNKIPTSVYYNIVKVAGNHNESLKKYLKLRKEYLHLDEYHTYDRFIQLASSDKKYSYDEAKEMFFKSVENFPEDFKEKAHEVLRDGFVDVMEKDGKRTGAYSAGVANLHPYILLNHDGTLDSCFTVAHEAGHSIHTLYTQEAQPTLLQNYTIFVAEIASTFNEHNLLDYLLASGKSTKEEKIMMIQKAIDSIMSTFYRQALFADYELISHDLNEKGEPINHEVLSNIMIDLYKKYYDLDIEKEEVKQYVWAYIPHLFHTPFYVYQYATSFAASFKLYKNVKEKVPHAFEKYIGLLKSGGSKYPMDEIMEAGVDFTKEDAFMAVVERMDELVKELEELLK